MTFENVVEHPPEKKHMNTQRWGEIEVIAHLPTSTPEKEHPSLLFVHGAYTAAWCWDEHFLPWFANRGYPSYALSLSGHGASREREYLDTYSIEDYVRDLAQVIHALPSPPVLIGHSMGGMVVQKYLEQAFAPAVVLMGSVPPHGLWSSTLGLMLKNPGLLRELNRIMGGSQPDMNLLRQALFYQPVDQKTLKRYYDACQPESHRAIWDMTLFNLPSTNRMHLPPILVMGGAEDEIISATSVSMTARTFGVEPHLFSGMGHALMLEQDWEKVALCIEEWLSSHVHHEVRSAKKTHRN
jgi:pimeloyl-ACP methyl ester carboxylesterase